MTRPSPVSPAAHAEAVARRKEILAHQRAIKRAVTPAERRAAQADLDATVGRYEAEDAAALAALDR